MRLLVSEQYIDSIVHGATIKVAILVIVLRVMLMNSRNFKSYSS